MAFGRRQKPKEAPVEKQPVSYANTQQFQQRQSPSSLPGYVFTGLAQDRVDLCKAALADGGIQEQNLKDLNHEILKEMGIAAPGDRMTILQNVATSHYTAKLHQPPENSPTNSSQTNDRYISPKVTPPPAQGSSIAQVSTATDKIPFPSNAVVVRVLKGDVTVGAEIGSGHFGTVYRGLLNGVTNIAMKTSPDRRELLAEAALWQKTTHPFIAQYLGTKEINKKVYVCSEFIQGGNLLNLLRRMKKELRNEDLLDMAHAATEGVSYLGSEGIIHRDLAARNLLVQVQDKKYVLKVCDFGLSRTPTGAIYKSRSGEAPIGWTAPEGLQNSSYSLKSDIWSMGVVLWELFSYGDYKNQTPYASDHFVYILEFLTAGHRLPKPAECSAALYGIMLQTWSEDPHKRPTAEELARLLKDQLYCNKNTDNRNSQRPDDDEGVEFLLETEL